MRTKPLRWPVPVFALLALAVASGLSAQPGGPYDPDEPQRGAGRDFRITILQTTDIHHHANGADHVGLDADPVTGRSAVGSYARIAAYVRWVREHADHPVVLVDSGDWTMGTLYDLTLGTQPLGLYFLDLMRYDCVTLGNHEFDYTSKGLAQILAAADRAFGFRTPIVASNMVLGGDADLASWVGDGKAIQATRTELLGNGVKVGFLGLMGEEAAIDAPGSAPVTFARLSTHYADIQRMVDELRNVENVQVVVALSHSGTDATGTAGEDVELARHVHGIDVIASGHTHTPLPSARAVTNGSWTTQIIDAGAFGTNVARLDLTWHPATGTTTASSSGSVPMTDAGLQAVDPSLAADPGITPLLLLADQQLDVALGPLFSRAFPDYDPGKPGKGIYHPVAVAAQEMVSNEKNPVLCPNGLGNLAADAVRSVPNAIAAQTLAAVGGNPANLPGYDFTPVQLGIVATGTLRGRLAGGVPLTFADVYDVLPLGISPDPAQALPVGYPLVSGYLDLDDVKKACALQLVAQTNLVSSQFYLNLSGVAYALDDAGADEYFRYATAAGVLQVTSQKAATGSTAALQALHALSSLADDHGEALLAAALGAGNRYAYAMVALNDTGALGTGQIAANLVALGEVAAAAAADQAAGTTTLNALIVAKAVRAIGTVSGFAPGDAACTGTATPLAASARARVTADLYAALLLGAVKAEFGVDFTLYRSGTGSDVLTDVPGLLASRVDLDPATAGVQELKEWMALLQYVGAGLHGAITADYASTASFAQFGSFGAAVTNRNASYPLPAIGRFLGALAALQQAP